jgi:hypothetical protein
MNLSKPLIIGALLVPLLGACAAVTDLVDKGRTYATKVAVEFVLAECSLPTLEQRKLNADAIALGLTEAGSPASLFTLDCDGDGLKDF